MLKKTLFAGCSKMVRYKAPMLVTSNKLRDEKMGLSLVTRHLSLSRDDEGNAVGERFSATC